VALVLVSLLVERGGQPLVPYRIGALVLGGGFLYVGVRFTRQRSRVAARRLLMASIVYLPSLLLLIVLLAPRG